MTYVFKRFDPKTEFVGDYGEFNHYPEMEQKDDGEYVLAQEAIDRDAVNQAEIKTLKAQVNSLRAPVNVFQMFNATMKMEPDYAWAWHCALACGMMDNCKVDHECANKAAARFMKNTFDIDTSQFSEFKALNLSE